MARADRKEERAEKERPSSTQQGPIESKTLLSVQCIKFPKVSKVTIEQTHIHILYNQVKVNKSVKLFMRSLIPNPPSSRILTMKYLER